MRVKVDVINEDGVYELLVPAAPRVGDFIPARGAVGTGRTVVKKVVDQPGEPLSVEAVAIGTDDDLDA